MINWILGGLIIGFTIFIIARFVNKTRKGQSSCCSGCSESNKSGCSCSMKS